MFKTKDEELLFKLFLKENKLKCEIYDGRDYKSCKIYTTGYIGGGKKTGHIDFKEKVYYVYGLPSTNLKIYKYLNEHDHNLSFSIEDDHPRGGVDSYYV